ncbi:hypothetical protein AURDEDRAFT_166118 [Auricularia subglabra TFB-10046 SS5]|nr:hypothetical protein AURDEDRAFT_166118 [Auricularia subglabra TFB-10046 SS5]
MASCIPEPDYTAHLPAEVLLCVFDWLDQPNVLGAALVSRRWRSAALKHHNHYAYLQLLRTNAAPWSTDVDFGVAAFCQSLRHCARHQLKLSLSIFLAADPTGWLEEIDGTTHDYSWLGLDVAGDAYAERLLPALKSCLAQVVSLRVSARKEYYDSLYSALCTPAPRLTKLDMNMSDFESPDSEELEGPPLPVDFLGRHAPQLRSVQLFRVQLPTAPIHVFADVPKVELSCRFQPPLKHVEAIFPRARDLFIGGGWILPDASVYVPRTTFSGLRELGLCALTDEECTPELQEAMRHCRSVYIDNTDGELFLRPLLGHLEGPFSVTLDKDDGTRFYARLEVTGLSEAPDQYSRILDFDDYHFSRKFLPQLAQYCGRIVELDVHYQFLAALVEGLDELPVLETLTIDVSDMRRWERLWRPTYMHGLRGVSVRESSEPLTWRARDGVPLEAIYSGDPRLRVRCPRLDQFVLQRDDSKACITLDTFELLHLARDLSLLRDDREPTVVLYKDASMVEFTGPPFIGLDMIFLNDIWEADFSDEENTSTP